MNTIPRISVVMPCYNEQANIEIAIKSVLSQTFSDFELIVVDDCSDDSSAEIIKRLESYDHRVVYLRNARNSGVAISLNNGLKISRGEFIARMDADDICESDRLRKQFQYMSTHPECILCGTLADVRNKNGLYTQGKTDKHLKRDLVVNNPFVHSSVMFRRIIDGQAVLYPETKGFEDYGLWISLCNKGGFYVIPEIMVHRFDYDNLQTKKTWEGFNKLSIYKKLRQYQKKATCATGYYLSGLGSVLLTDMKIAYTAIKTHNKG